MVAIETKLYKYSAYKRQIEDLENQIKEILDKKDALADRILNGKSLENIRVMGGFSSDPVFEAVRKMVDVYGTRIDAIRNELVSLYFLVDEIMNIVNSAGLTEAERKYVQYRYFEGLRASQTAAKMGYSESRAGDIKRSALNKISANKRR